MKDNKIDNEENDYEFEFFIFWVFMSVCFCIILLSFYLIIQ